MIARHRWSRSTFYRRVDEGSARIASVLDERGAMVVCTGCGQRGADVRPDWQSAERSFPERKAGRY